MEVRVLFFGMLKDLAGRASDRITVREGASVGDVLAHYQERIPQFRQLLPSIAMSVNQEYAGREAALHADDEIALLPPVSGGAGRARIVREKIDTQRVLEEIKQGEDGAVAVFEGIVRNNTRGRRTLYLDYECYEEMALKQMEGLAEKALADFKVRQVAIVHRVGRLEIGETSVLIVVASAHRGPAFEACRWAIEALKRTVPIWKKEYFEDGAVWADGESFPAEVPRAEGTPCGRPASKC